jgi:hypothetical protein
MLKSEDPVNLLRIAAEVDQHLDNESLRFRMMNEARFEGYSQLSVVPCCVNGFTPRVGRRW